MGTSLKTAFILKISIKESGFYLYIVPTREHPLKQFLKVPLYWHSIRKKT